MYKLYTESETMDQCFLFMNDQIWYTITHNSVIYLCIILYMQKVRPDSGKPTSSAHPGQCQLQGMVHNFMPLGRFISCWQALKFGGLILNKHYTDYNLAGWS